MTAFASMPDEDAGPIFGPYLQGLTFLGKTDLSRASRQLGQNGFAK